MELRHLREDLDLTCHLEQACQRSSSRPRQAVEPESGIIASSAGLHYRTCYLEVIFRKPRAIKLPTPSSL